MITYPRKCEFCDYISNNPAMFHYHKHIHEPILDGTLCDIGCGRLGKFRRTNGKVACEQNSHHCPAYIAAHSQSVKQQWKDNEWKERRLHIATLMHNLSPKQLEQHKQSGIETKRLKRIATETSKDQRVYSRAVIYHSRKTYIENKHILNPNNSWCWPRSW